MEIIKDGTGVFWSVRGTETFGPSQITTQPPSLVARFYEKIADSSLILGGLALGVDNAIKNDFEITLVGWLSSLVGGIIMYEKRSEIYNGIFKDF